MIELPTYCEDYPYFWKEPLNFFSNFSFVFSLFFISRKMKIATAPIIIKVMVFFLIIFTIGSFSFHFHRSQFTHYLDAIPILIFMLLAFSSICFVKRNIFCTLVLSLIFLSANVLLVSNRSIPISAYQFTLASLMVLIITNKSLVDPKNGYLAALSFFFALIFREIDLIVCHDLKTGTHFLWHLLNGLTTYFIILYSNSCILIKKDRHFSDI